MHASIESDLHSGVDFPWRPIAMDSIHVITYGPRESP